MRNAEGFCKAWQTFREQLEHRVESLPEADAQHENHIPADVIIGTYIDHSLSNANSTARKKRAPVSALASRVLQPNEKVTTTVAMICLAV